MEQHTWVEVDGTTFIAWPDHGCFVEKGHSPQDIGALYAPMLLGGAMDIDNLGEIEVAYEDA